MLSVIKQSLSVAWTWYVCALIEVADFIWAPTGFVARKEGDETEDHSALFQVHVMGSKMSHGSRESGGTSQS